MNLVTFLSPDSFIFARMLFLLAIIRFALPPEPPANDLLAYAQLRIGHVALTVIALVYVLITFWQH